MKTATFSWLASATLVAACQGPLPPENPQTQPDQRATVAPILAATTSPSDAAPPKPTEVETTTAPPPIVYQDVGLSTPESVLYDPDGDVYLVSNINGKPDAQDNNGFISVLNPDGTVKTLKWAEGGKDGVRLSAPKGMALVNGKLWVSDINHLRRFDYKSGKLEAAIMIAGATFLNDVAVGPGGAIYVSDSGMKVGKEGFDPTGTDAVYKIENGKPVALLKQPDLGRPNGLAFAGDKLLSVTMAANILRELDLNGKELQKAELPAGGLDGLVVLGENDFLVSSWQASTVFRGGFGSGFKPILENEKSPADIGYDSKRKRILIPVFMGDQVRAVALPGAHATEAASGPAGATPTTPPPTAAPPTPTPTPGAAKPSGAGN